MYQQLRIHLDDNSFQKSWGESINQWIYWKLEVVIHEYYIMILKSKNRNIKVLKFLNEMGLKLYVAFTLQHWRNLN